MSNLCQIFVKSLSILFLSPFPVNVSYFNDLSNFCQIFFKSLSNLCQFFFPLRFLWMFLISMIYQIFVKSFSNLCQIFVKSLSNLNPFPVNVTSCNDFLKTFITYRSSKKDVKTAFHLETLWPTCTSPEWISKGISDSI